MRINIPQKDELARVNEIAKQVHELHVNWRPDIFVSVDEVIEKERFEDLVDNKQIYVIREEDTIIGYATILIKERQTHGMHNRKILELEAICVDQNYRGNGAGTELINYLIDLGKKENCTEIRLTVNEENTSAIKLYERIGMKVKNIAYSMKLQ